MSPKLENFREAFSPPWSSIVTTCHCGVIYYDSQDESCFEEGELESLRANPEAVELDRGTGFVTFEGKQYCWDCTCWHKRAEQIIGFIDSHAGGIADYLTRERKRKFDEAESSPVVSD